MSGLRGKDRPGAADVRAAEDSSQRDDLVVEFGFPAASEAAIGSDGRQVDVGHGPELAADERRVSARQLSAWLTLVCATCIVVVALQSLALGGLRVDAPMVQYTGPDGTTIAPLITDQVEYLRMVDHYRGDGPGSSVEPFSSRVGVPWLASHLPWSAPLSFALVSTTLLLAGVVATLVLVWRWSPTWRPLLWSSLAWCAAVPLVGLGGPWSVDLSLLGSLGIIIWATYRRPWLAPLLMVGAPIIKESALVAVPFGIAAALLGVGVLDLTGSAGAAARRRPRLVLAISWIVAAVLGLSLVHRFGMPSNARFAPWVPDGTATVGRWLGLNFTPRSGAFAAFGVILVPVAGLSAAWSASRRDIDPLRADRDRVVPLCIGTACALVLVVVAALVASLSGRVASIAVPFAVPLAGLCIARLPSPRSIARPWRGLSRRVVTGAVVVSTGIGVLPLIAVVLLTAKVLAGGVTEPTTTPASSSTFYWDHVSDMTGAGDFRIDAPNPGSLGRSTVTFQGSGSVVVGGPGPRRVLSGQIVELPPGVPAFEIRTDGAWRLTPP